MRQAAVWRTIEVMTTKTFQEFFSENLSEFGWSLSSTDIPDWSTYTDAMVRIVQWWDGLDSHSRDILRRADFSDGLNEQGYFSTFPGLQPCSPAARWATSTRPSTTSSPAADGPTSRSTSRPSRSATCSRSSADEYSREGECVNYLRTMACAGSSRDTRVPVIRGR